mgnify:CR=1 FL=1
MKTIKDTFNLHNGIKIPKLGFGTAPLKGDEAYNAVKTALKLGYTHIDTAQSYDNEAAVGRALKDANIKRKDVFITTKLASHIKTYQGTLDAFETSLKHLNTDYVDLYLIHAPWPWDQKFSKHDVGNVQAYKAMESLLKAGKIKAIGVSNFSPEDLDNIITNCTIKPHVNQIKFHIGHIKQETLDYCQSRDILVEAYSPLGRAKVLEHPTLINIAQTYRVSVPKLCIRYVLQKGVLPLPRSSKDAHIKANKDVDFTISDKDMKTLDELEIESVEFGTPIHKR